MTRNTCVNAFICGSHICSVVPSEFDSISVGPPSRPSTDTLSRQPSASIMGIVLVLCRSEQSVDQGLRDALIGRRLEQFCKCGCIEMCRHPAISHEHVAQMFFLGHRLLAGGLDQMM